MFFLYLIFFICFTVLAWKKFRLAAIAFVVLLPAYLLRFDVGPLPSTVLEISFGAIFMVWLFKYAKKDWPVLKKTIGTYKIFFILVLLFLVASVIGIFVSDMVVASLGQWRAYFLEPVILFCIFVAHSSVIPSVSEESLSAIDLFWGLSLSTLSVSVYCIFQEFTGWGIATPEWTALATRRTTAFFSSPNAVGLYLGPVIILITAYLAKKFSNRVELAEKKYWQSPWFYLALIEFLSLTAVIFSKSRGAWVAIAVSMLIFIFLIGYKKFALSLSAVAIAAGLIILVIHPLNLDKSGQNRLKLWSYTETYLTASPKNFVLGTGIRQFFRKIQKPYYNDKEMERLIYPHNIFLNFWTETGLLGMLSFSGILGYGFYLANKIRKYDKITGAGLICALLAIVIHGMVDVPYFKNDLAMMFWIIVGLILMNHNKFTKPNN